MNYKYIEQLLERYWECQTTLEEEAILRAFFAQDNVPVELLQYRQLFIAQNEEKKEVRISDDFEERMLSIISDEKPVKARSITLSQRLRPLYRAVAVVAVIITLGTDRLALPFADSETACGTQRTVCCGQGQCEV